MKVLVTGASGLLGKYLMRTAPEDWDVVGTRFKSVLPSALRMDITIDADVKRVFERVEPAIVIHCAAIGSVDYCETHMEEAYRVNMQGTEHVLDWSEKYGAKFVFISTNAVFAGLNPPYSETDDCHPISRYGTIKMAAENMVRYDYLHNYLIIRPIMLYGWPYSSGRGNWVTRTLEFLGDGHKLCVVDDTMTQPTYAEDCANAIWGLLKLGKTGIYHVGGLTRMSLHEMVTHVASVWNLSTDSLQAVPSSYFTGIAPRPRDTTYDLTKLWNLDVESIRPGSLIDGLRRMWSDAT